MRYTIRCRMSLWTSGWLAASRMQALEINVAEDRPSDSPGCPEVQLHIYWMSHWSSPWSNSTEQ